MRQYASAGKILSILLAHAAVSTAFGTTTISTLPPDKFSAVGGRSDFGQEFTVPSDGDNYFADFTFNLGGAGAVVEFQSQIYQINPSTFQLLGAPLYTSAPTFAPRLQPPTAISFDPPTPIALTADATYIFTFQQGVFANPNGNLQWNAGGTLSNVGLFLQANPTVSGYYMPISIFPAPVSFTATFVPEPAIGFSALLVCSMFCRRPRRN